MKRIIDVPALHRITVDIFQLLQHYGITTDLLGFAPFFPDLILALGLVPQLEGAQLLKQNLGSVRTPADR
jgi:hypothetical protein